MPTYEVLLYISYVKAITNPDYLLFYNVLLAYSKNLINRKAKQVLLRKLRFNLFNNKAPILLYYYCKYKLSKVHENMRLFFDLHSKWGNTPTLSYSAGHPKLFISYYPFYCDCKSIISMFLLADEREAELVSEQNFVWHIGHSLYYSYTFFFLYMHLEAVLSDHFELNELNAIRIYSYITAFGSITPREFSIISMDDRKSNLHVGSILTRFQSAWKRIHLDELYYDADSLFFRIYLSFHTEQTIILPPYTIPVIHAYIREIKEKGILTVYDFKIRR